MGIAYNLVAVRILLENIVRNYRRLADLAPGSIPVIKADAYGHGLAPVAKALADAGATFLAAGTVDEAVRLRESPFAGRILVLLGPQDGREARAVIEHALMPLVYRADQLSLLDEAVRCDGRAIPAPLALKFDTGMARLGFAPEQAADLADTLRPLFRLRAGLVCTHLASADNPDEAPFVREQAERFATLLAVLRAALPGHPLAPSIANSAALLAWPELRPAHARPGIALYGANPFSGTSLEPLGRELLPAMEVTAPVLQVHPLPRGRSISYGRTFTAARDMDVAIVAAGYADGYSRALSSPRGDGAAVLLHGRRAPLLGRVCMQMIAVDVSDIPDVRPGDRAFLLGGACDMAIRPDELAAWWGTIPYELMCLLGLNPRIWEPVVQG